MLSTNICGTNFFCVSTAFCTTYNSISFITVNADVSECRLHRRGSNMVDELSPVNRLLFIDLLRIYSAQAEKPEDLGSENKGEDEVEDGAKCHAGVGGGDEVLLEDDNKIKDASVDGTPEANDPAHVDENDSEANGEFGTEREDIDEDDSEDLEKEMERHENCSTDNEDGDEVEDGSVNDVEEDNSKGSDEEGNEDEEDEDSDSNDAEQEE
ncbi:hypothetical protein Aperf_G00000113361 [Anoplocephala perfoliata]